MRCHRVPSQLLKRPSSFVLQPRRISPGFVYDKPRWSSTAPVTSSHEPSLIDIESIKQAMTCRPIQVHPDTLSPIQHRLLKNLLDDMIPGPDPDPEFVDPSNVLPRPSLQSLPPGHHLVYFPLQKLPSALCPDGTDPYHMPPLADFTRRLWTGGSIEGMSDLTMGFDNRHACVESIEDVELRTSDTIAVRVLRRHMSAKHVNYYTSEKPPEKKGRQIKGLLTERRTLVFMREPSAQVKKRTLERPPMMRILKSPWHADHSVMITPTPAHLFQYSALSYNAHRIHFDRAHCTQVEGYRNMLVHGPLSLTLVLEVLRRHINAGLSPTEKVVRRLDQVHYSHIAPLYAGEPLRVCFRQNAFAQSATHPDTYNVWVENHHGSMCVKATVRITTKADNWRKRMAFGAGISNALKPILHDPFKPSST
ncbi:hypothetical protein GGR57DRAFT_241716 [Xylariaceae sp. FL1272]|nr:hypothetical protein GGR57DRAFT_241716 [Xylariaceae sp. FL1272]